MASDPILTPDLLLRAYASGVFPMADDAAAEELFWVDPIRRGVLPLEALRVSRRLARDFLGKPFEIRIDADFAGTVRACADRETTWINGEIFRLYRELHRMGHAHSVEIWQGDTLAGGLYGVVLGAAFFGESMFSRMRDGSKFALVALVARLRAGGFTLLDTQFITPHLESLGAVEITRAEYRARLAAALRRPADFRALPMGATRRALLDLARE
ncbi:leucyl/phenylalanyl-tRNA--protein transferase [Amaricoccus solimangrovi]|uniref:Leucyl/phenylalanyl-tRNA--protein transferase n=1 Tax=Amaricoccus solimangrovi TaxID=2589815 RepID=A0A501WIQ1_9RHOB|nr:leucyl/phenylalanyl-tRNA--protein transferase [Amaricoccus solimangrovi]TPE49228.1 leucyl/phenylalanyl-tRNA--protein transferase [Amaricoccus solimangrovi]